MKKRIFFISLLCVVTLLSNAQDVIITHSDEMIRAYNIEIGQSAVFYTLQDSVGAQVHKIAKSDIFIIKKADGTHVDPNENNVSVAQQTENAPAAKTPLDLSNFHGYLMGRGCNVFVTSNAGLSYEQPAVEALKRALKARNYWNVVETVEEAHFVIQFGICTRGSDRAFVYARTRDSYSKCPSSTYDIGMYKVREPGSINIVVGEGSEDGEANAALAIRLVNGPFFISYEIEDDDPILQSLKNGEYPNRHAFSFNGRAERVKGTVPASWYISFSLKTFWNQWLQFYVP